MNTIQNYEMTNYQMGFQAKGSKVAKRFANKGKQTIQSYQRYKKMTPQDKLTKLQNKYADGQINGEQFVTKIIHILNTVI